MLRVTHFSIPDKSGFLHVHYRAFACMDFDSRHLAGTHFSIIAMRGCQRIADNNSKRPHSTLCEMGLKPTIKALGYSGTSNGQIHCDAQQLRARKLFGTGAAAIPQ